MNWWSSHKTFDWIQNATINDPIDGRPTITFLWEGLNQVSYPQAFEEMFSLTKRKFSPFIVDSLLEGSH